MTLVNLFMSLESGHLQLGYHFLWDVPRPFLYRYGETQGIGGVEETRHPLSFNLWPQQAAGSGDPTPAWPQPSPATLRHRTAAELTPPSQNGRRGTTGGGRGSTSWIIMWVWSPPCWCYCWHLPESPNSTVHVFMFYSVLLLCSVGDISVYPYMYRTWLRPPVSC